MDKSDNLSSKEIRRIVLDMAYNGATAHIACAYSIVDILVEIYKNHLMLDVQNPQNPMRDYLVLSKGHGVMAQYAILNYMGLISYNEIRSYMQDGTRLSGLSEVGTPGIEVTSGSLGHGLSVGIGLALAAKKRGTNQHVYVIVGDGEMNEGTIWEGLLFAAQWKLSNLIVIVDKNGLQAMGKTADILDLHNLMDKFDAFEFDCREINGHDIEQINQSIHDLNHLESDRPKAIVANTIKGKGLRAIENNNEWHYKRVTEEIYMQGILEIEAGDVT